MAIRFLWSGVALTLAALVPLTATSGCSSKGSANASEQGVTVPKPQKIIVFVWDGLRPDVITDVDTPNLKALIAEGSYFADNHSTFPTFTMMNAATFATGSFPGETGFFGNTLWAPGTQGSDSAGHPFDFNQPVFTEDYGLLSALSTFYNNELLMVGTLFQAAQKAGLKTAAVGKSGPAFLQDYLKGGLILDEKMAYPAELAKAIQAAGFALPKLTPVLYPDGGVTLSADNGDPTAQAPRKNLSDKTTSDPTDSSGAPPSAANAYMMKVYLEYILPERDPDLSFVWFRNPDATQHTYGVGVPNAVDALHAQDALLGQLRSKLTALGLDDRTNIVVVSDHGHSTIAGRTDLFPLRAVANGATGDPDSQNGFSASGAVRLADLMSRAGFTVFDGTGCAFEPVMSGIKADGTHVYPTQTDTDGHVCGAAGKQYSTPGYLVPATLPPNAAVIAMNGGSDYIYVPSHDAALVNKIASFLQSREEFGAIFVGGAYGSVPGTIPLETVRAAGTGGRNPDIIASYAFDDTAVVAGRPGIEYSSMQGFNNRGMHGSFSPIDVHNTLTARGPAFKKGYTDNLPSGNVDVAPTLARILGISLDQADGRPLLEALTREGTDEHAFDVHPEVLGPDAPARGLTMKLPTDPAGHDVDTGKTSYTIELHTKVLQHGYDSYRYFDYAKAVRQ